MKRLEAKVNLKCRPKFDTFFSTKICYYFYFIMLQRTSESECVCPQYNITAIFTQKKMVVKETWQKPVTSYLATIFMGHSRRDANLNHKKQNHKECTLTSTIFLKSDKTFSRNMLQISTTANNLVMQLDFLLLNSIYSKMGKVYQVLQVEILYDV